MRITVNGDDVDVADGATVADVAAALGVPDRGVAVAVDREVIPRSRWTEATLTDGARVEVVTAAAGG